MADKGCDINAHYRRTHDVLFSSNFNLIYKKLMMVGKRVCYITVLIFLFLRKLITMAGLVSRLDGYMNYALCYE